MVQGIIDYVNYLSPSFGAFRIVRHVSLFRLAHKLLLILSYPDRNRKKRDRTWHSLTPLLNKLQPLDIEMICNSLSKLPRSPNKCPIAHVRLANETHKSCLEKIRTILFKAIVGGEVRVPA